MKRRWLWIVLGMLAIVVIAAVAVAVYIDAIARRAVERRASWALGVETTVGDMDVGWLAGRVKFGDVQVDNPQGFASSHFLTLDDGDLAVTLGSLRQETVVVARLRLERVDMHLEKRDGRANYQVILENLRRGEAAPPPEEQEKPGKRFIINELVILDTTVHTDLLGVGGRITQLDVEIPEIRLEDVGSETDRGVLLSELSGVITKAILDAVARRAGLPPELAGEILSGLEQLDELGRQGVEVIGQVQRRLEGLLQDPARALEGDDPQRAIEGLREDAEKTVRDIGGTLRGVEGALRGQRREGEREEPAEREAPAEPER